MDLPANPFKVAMRSSGAPLIGLWATLVDSAAAELAAGADFDWLLLDGEHAPNDLRTLLAQLQAVAPYRSQPVVRPPAADRVRIKQLLDIGAQNLLLPMIESAEQAREAVAATRYPPAGVRGVGAGPARASRWTRFGNYLNQADDQVCLILQVESPAGLASLEAIATTPGVDGVFIGPADLAASMGHRGQPQQPQVQAAIAAAIATLKRLNVPAGILALDEAAARRYLELGCRFVAVGIDSVILARALDALAARYRTGGQR